METLASWIAQEGKLAVQDAVGWVVRVAKALEPIHKLGIAHGRLSAEAILTTGSNCLGDGAVVGTADIADAVAYHCPDRARGKDASIHSDTWALAIILYEALTGSRPFRATTDDQLLAEIGGVGPAPLSRAGVDAEEVELVLRRALSLSRKLRLRDLRKFRDALIEVVPEVGELPALQLGSGQSGADHDEVEEAPTQKLDNVTELTRHVLIRKGAIPGVATALPTDDDDEEDLVEYDDPAPEPITAASLVDEDDQVATKLMDVSEDSALAALRVELNKRAEQEALAEDATLQQRRPPLPPPRSKPAAPPSSPGRRPSAALDIGAPGDLPRPPRGIDFGDAEAALRTRRESSSDRIDGDALRSAGVDLPGAGRRPAPKPAPEPEPPTAVEGAIARRRPMGPALEPTEAVDAPVIDEAPPPVDEAVPDEAPASRRRGPIRTFLRLVFLAALGAATALLVFRPDARRDFVAWVHHRTGYVIPLPKTELPAAAPQATPTAASTATTSASTSASAVPGKATAVPSTDPAAVSSAATSAEPSASASATSTATGTAQATSAPAAAGGHAECVQKLFPAGSFEGFEPDFGFLCTETNPRKGATALKTQIVLGGGSGHATEAMQQWALLGWYEMGAYAAVRARCCSDDAPPLTTPASLAHCQLDDSLENLRAAVVGSSDEAVDEAIKEYTKSLHCLHQVGAASVFGLKGPPRGGERSAFADLVTRIRKVEGR
ncbi:MAG: hypothetical protein JRI23_12090 [Deltaproteobacteria bacterium]|jgi:hypothetical protein|nr:hypothetical protein [Deltaproteobacteria bacterium]MBW2532449.1 hypothetical protein [Deltaproteobacteria bacterium]